MGFTFDKKNPNNTGWDHPPTPYEDEGIRHCPVHDESNETCGCIVYNDDQVSMYCWCCADFFDTLNGKPVCPDCYKTGEVTINLFDIYATIKDTPVRAPKHVRRYSTDSFDEIYEFGMHNGLTVASREIINLLPKKEGEE